MPVCRDMTAMNARLRYAGSQSARVQAHWADQGRDRRPRRCVNGRTPRVGDGRVQHSQGRAQVSTKSVGTPSPSPGARLMQKTLGISGARLPGQGTREQASISARRHVLCVLSKPAQSAFQKIGPAVPGGPDGCTAEHQFARFPEARPRCAGIEHGQHGRKARGTSYRRPQGSGPALLKQGLAPPKRERLGSDRSKLNIEPEACHAEICGTAGKIDGNASAFAK